MRTIETKIYKFDELTDEAKERARQWWRGASVHDDWYEYVYEDFERVANLIGIELEQRQVKLMGGGTRSDPIIYFSGFSSQGDGACYEGRWTYKADALKQVKDYAPKDERLHAIAEVLSNPRYQSLYADCKHSGHYYNSGCMRVEVSPDYDSTFEVSHETEDEIKTQLRLLADWLYRQLEEEYDYRNADEQVDDSLRGNDYEFTENGKLA